MRAYAVSALSYDDEKLRNDVDRELIENFEIHSDDKTLLFLQQPQMYRNLFSFVNGFIHLFLIVYIVKITGLICISKLPAVSLF